jgi:hypothetical protein
LIEKSAPSVRDWRVHPIFSQLRFPSALYPLKSRKQNWLPWGSSAKLSACTSEKIRNEEHQTLETLINEEAQLFAKYLRSEINAWVPRVPGN